MLRIENYNPEIKLKLLIGNKSDLKNPMVPYDKGKEFSKKHDMHFLEVSAKNNNNIDEILPFLVSKIYKGLTIKDIIPNETNGIKSNNKPSMICKFDNTKSKKKCC